MWRGYGGEHELFLKNIRQMFNGSLYCNNKLIKLIKDYAPIFYDLKDKNAPGYHVTYYDLNRVCDELIKMSVVLDFSKVVMVISTAILLYLVKEKIMRCSVEYDNHQEVDFLSEHTNECHDAHSE